MANIYAYFTPQDHELTMDSALMSETPEESLSKWSAPLEKAFNDISLYANYQLGGQCIAQFGTSICIRVPLDKITDLTQFVVRFENTSKVSFAVGMGLNPLEAYKAMLMAQANGADRIYLFSEETDTLNKTEGFGLELPNFQLDEEEVEVSEEPKEKATAKQKIVETLLLLKQKGPIIQQLKEIDSGAYQAVKKLVDALILMATEGIEKSEKIEKDLKDVPMGRQKPVGIGGYSRFGYSHLLSPEHRKAGYSIRVGHREHPDGGTQIMANLFHHTTKVGEVHGLAAVGSEMNDEGTAWNYKDLNTLRLNTSQVHEAHRGKGLGTALYESTLAHAHNHLGVQQVEGARHSSMASGTHSKVSQKHGLGYQPKLHPNASPDAPKQAYDGKFDNYRYALKNESDVKQILKSEEFSLEDSFDSEESEKSLDEVSGEESSVVEELVQEGKVTIKGVNS